MFLLIVFVIFCQKEIGKKAASKMLEKLTHAHVEKVIIQETQKTRSDRELAKFISC